jgi:hypothetical protein
MTTVGCNCIVCAEEFNPEELQNVTLSKINVTRFKICQACLNKCDPSDDYRQARDIVNSYLQYSQAKNLFSEAIDLIDSIKKN